MQSVAIHFSEMTFPRCVISVPMLQSIWPGWQHQKFEKFMVFGISWQWRHHRWRLEWGQWQKWIQSRELKSLFCPVNIDLKNHTYLKIRILNNFESQNICFVKKPDLVQNKVKKELKGQTRSREIINTCHGHSHLKESTWLQFLASPAKQAFCKPSSTSNISDFVWVV